MAGQGGGYGCLLCPETVKRPPHSPMRVKYGAAHIARENRCCSSCSGSTLVACRTFDFSVSAAAATAAVLLAEKRGMFSRQWRASV